MEGNYLVKCIAVSLIMPILFFNNTMVLACPQCRPMVEASVYNQDFAANIFVLILPLAVLFAIGIGIHYLDAITTRLAKYKGNDT